MLTKQFTSFGAHIPQAHFTVPNTSQMTMNGIPCKRFNSALMCDCYWAEGKMRITFASFIQMDTPVGCSKHKCGFFPIGELNPRKTRYETCRWNTKLWIISPEVRFQTMARLSLPDWWISCELNGDPEPISTWKHCSMRAYCEGIHSLGMSCESKFRV